MTTANKEPGVCHEWWYTTKNENPQIAQMTQIFNALRLCVALFLVEKGGIEDYPHKRRDAVRGARRLEQNKL
jgi:hypothetical protein